MAVVVVAKFWKQNATYMYSFVPIHTFVYIYTCIYSLYLNYVQILLNLEESWCSNHLLIFSLIYHPVPIFEAGS